MTTLNNMDHTERTDSSLRFILQNNNRLPFQLAIDPDTGEYGYIKDGADSVTPFRESTWNIKEAIFSCGVNGGIIYLSSDGNMYGKVSYPISDINQSSDVFKIEGIDNGQPGVVGAAWSARITFRKTGYYLIATHNSSWGNMAPILKNEGDTVTFTAGYALTSSVPFYVIYLGDDDPSQ